MANSEILNQAQNGLNDLGNKGLDAARKVQDATQVIPSDALLVAALGSITASAVLQILGKKEAANFVGHWAPTFLVLGVFNRLLKLEERVG